MPWTDTVWTWQKKEEFGVTVYCKSCIQAKAQIHKENILGFEFVTVKLNLPFRVLIVEANKWHHQLLL